MNAWSETSPEVIAIQLCSITTPAKLTNLEVVIEGRINSVSAMSFSLDGVTSVSEAWVARSLTDQYVASYWGDISDDQMPTFIIVDGQVLPLEANNISGRKWTAWAAPKFKVANGYSWALNRVNNKKPALGAGNGNDSNFRFRFKRMTFDDYLSNMPKQNGPTKAWSSDPIPACQ
jgi:hypothetical protein